MCSTYLFDCRWLADPEEALTIGDMGTRWIEKQAVHLWGELAADGHRVAYDGMPRRQEPSQRPSAAAPGAVG